MGFLKQTKIFFLWYARVFGEFWRVKPRVLISIVFLAVIERFFSLIALILPLKIILLASSDGIPIYFQFFMDPSDKQLWIFGLSAASLGFHLMGLGFSAWSDRLTTSGGAEVVAKANDINFAHKVEKQFKSYYFVFCRVLSSAVFALVAFSLLAWLDYFLLAALFCAVAGEYILSAWILEGGSSGLINNISLFVSEKLSDYLNFFAFLNFIICFVVVLMPFVLGYPASVLGAIVSLILLRRAISDLSCIVKDSVKLWSWKAQIDPLVFRHVQVSKDEVRESISMNELLMKSNREVWIKDVLPKNYSHLKDVRVEWIDPPQKGMAKFSIIFGDVYLDKDEKLLLQVLDSRFHHYITNEQYLFEHVCRNALLAPESISTSIVEECAVQLLAIGVSKQVAISNWEEAEKNILLEHWVCEPPPALVEGYITSHPLLYQRLSKKIFMNVSLAIDSNEEMKIFHEFMQFHSQLMEILESLPLYIYNPDLQRNNVYVSDDGNDSYFVAGWGKWSLEPVGVRLPLGADDGFLFEMLEELKAKRIGLPQEYNLIYLKIAYQLFRIEKLIVGQRYKAVLVEMSFIIDNLKLLKRQPVAEFV
ncbi:hypothetical protein [Microbulbifer sp. GL-2]|uniref:hypothetical protein n=1 Tax=Microbulbifer sp. GL-2 TaxID=2591606 RepID=UPI001162B1EC|nr:hypothetical protein [Microbulbifer sp. GL-2]BBM03890.1 hypothetical protein GL2_39640 [Microbulbifer sp. GL-2]